MLETLLAEYRSYYANRLSTTMAGSQERDEVLAELEDKLTLLLASNRELGNKSKARPTQTSFCCLPRSCESTSGSCTAPRRRSSWRSSTGWCRS